MKPLHVLIVDDEPPARSKLIKLLSFEERVHRISEAENGIEAITIIEKDSPDLVFLDIQMPGISGFEVIDSVESDSMPVIVFVTAFSEYALDAFNVDAIDYLLKPYDKARFHKAFVRAIRRIDLEQELKPDYFNFLSKVSLRKDRFLIKEGDRYFFVPVKEVIVLTSADKYVELTTANSKYLIRDTLTHLEQSLDRTFVRIHRSTMINVDYVKEIQPLSHGDCTVILTTGGNVTLSRRYRNRLL